MLFLAGHTRHCQSDGCLKAGVMHRDVTLDNIGIVDKRGILFDFSAAKVRSLLIVNLLD